jgi:hypothetical protein
MGRFGVVVSLLIIVALIAAWAALGFPTDIQSISDRYEQAYQEHRAAYDIVSFVIGNVEAFLDSHDGAVTAIATAFIAIFTIVLARVGRSQSRDTRILQRAYIAVEARGIEQAIEDRGDRVHALVAFRNAGHLPARNVSWWVDIGEPEDVENPPVPTPKPLKGVLPAGTEIRTASGHFFSNKTGNWLYVWGIVTYEDGFGVSRFTKFCHRYRSKSWVRSELAFSIPASEARYWPYGNDAD